MTEGDCLNACLTRDPQRIWQACGWVRTSCDRAALRRLDQAQGEACFCAPLPEDDLADPRPLATAGHLTLTQDRIASAAGDGQMPCHCPTCGAAYLTTEVLGYHYPWYRWERVQGNGGTRWTSS